MNLPSDIVDPLQGSFFRTGNVKMKASSKLGRARTIR